MLCVIGEYARPILTFLLLFFLFSSSKKNLRFESIEKFNSIQSIIIVLVTHVIHSKLIIIIISINMLLCWQYCKIFTYHFIPILNWLTRSYHGRFSYTRRVVILLVIRVSNDYKSYSFNQEKEHI